VTIVSLEIWLVDYLILFHHSKRDIKSV